MNRIETRLNRLKTRVDAAEPPKDARLLIARMGRYFDPEGIPLLIELLEHADERAGHAMRTLVRYGEAAEESLHDIIVHKKADDTLARHHAKRALQRIRNRVRYEQIVGRRLP